MKKQLSIHNHQVVKGKNQRTKLWHQFLGKILPKEYTKTKKVNNAPHLISQSKPPAPK